jgi:hypothetical protein
MNVVLIWAILAVVFFVGVVMRINRNERIAKTSLHQKLMASTLKNPDDGPYYF